MHLEEAADLIDDVIETTRLVARRGLETVAVHGITDPRHHRAGRGDLLHDRGQRLADRSGAHPGDERQPSRLTRRVELVDKTQEVVRLGRRPYLHTDRVADSRDEVDVCPVEVAGSLTHPDEVTG